MPNNVDGSTPNNSESDSQLGQIVVHHVGIVGIPFHELLVIFLGRIKAVERADLGDDRLLENLRVAELLDVSFGDALDRKSALTSVTIGFLKTCASPSCLM